MFNQLHINYYVLINNVSFINIKLGGALILVHSLIIRTCYYYYYYYRCYHYYH